VAVGVGVGGSTVLTTGVGVAVGVAVGVGVGGSTVLTTGVGVAVGVAAGVGVGGSTVLTTGVGVVVGVGVVTGGMKVLAVDVGLGAAAMWVSVWATGMSVGVAHWQAVSARMLLRTTSKTKMNRARRIARTSNLPSRIES